jgi:molybdopterin-guanine dinucleotide biosynthesis adapter protein
MKVIGFIGSSGSGKTTLIERVIPVLVQRGLSVSAVKHAHQGFDIDRPGKDSFRLRVAGAGQVLVAAPQRWALMTELRGQPPRLQQLLAQLAPCDLVLVEGYRSETSIPCIEVRGPAFAARAAAAGAPDSGTGATAAGLPAAARSAEAADQNRIAIVCDDPIDSALPRFARDEVAAIAAFIAAQPDLDR